MSRISEEHPLMCLKMGMGDKAGGTTPFSCTPPYFSGSVQSHKHEDIHKDSKEKNMAWQI